MRTIITKHVVTVDDSTTIEVYQDAEGDAVVELVTEERGDVHRQTLACGNDHYLVELRDLVEGLKAAMEVKL